MHIVLKVLIGVVVLLGAILVVFPKKENRSLRSNRTVEPHTYYYYPMANFYYDSTAGNYICWDSSAVEWKTTDKLPVQQEDLGKRVRIGNFPAPVWKENQNHRLIYSVSLYSDPKDFKNKEKPVAKDSAKSDSSIISEEEEEKKNGVKKFFDRIFTKKKKDS